MADYQSWKFGGLSFPLSTSTGNSLLQDADPSLFFALDYYSFMIRTYVGARLLAELTAANVLGPDGAAIANAVRTRIPVDPKENAVGAQYPPPLLAIWRESAASEQKTTVHAVDVSTWSLAYILPPLTAAQSEKVEPILHAVQILLQHATEAGWDPAYTPPGGTTAEQAWHAAGLERIDFDGSQYGPVPDITGQIWAPALLARLRVKERGTSVENLVAFQGSVVELDVQPPDGSAKLANVVDVNTWVVIPKPGP